MSEDFTGTGIPSIYENSIINRIQVNDKCANIIANFSYDYIYHIVVESMKEKFKPYNSVGLPNIVDALEQEFRLQYELSPGGADEISARREEVYSTIISIICNQCGVEYDRDGGTGDIYADAFYIYDFFVSNFTTYMFSFLVNYITDEKGFLFRTLGVEIPTKKPKDANMQYAKSMDMDPVMAMIHSQLASILINMKEYDITYDVIIAKTFVADAGAQIRMLSMIRDKGCYFNCFKAYMEGIYLADTLTTTKMKLQSNII